MRILGFDISRPGSAVAESEKALQPVNNHGNWWHLIRESFTGAWQQNIEVKTETALSHGAVFRCIGLISNDVAKMRIRLMAIDDDGIRKEVKRPKFSPVLTKPNRFENRIQFYTNWVQSKLVHGNTYVLKQRDGRGDIVGLYILHPDCVKPLVADNGDIFYELARDSLAGVDDTRVVVPATEIIHDRINTIFHPLVGVSPLYACGLAAQQGLNIQNNSAHFFANGSRPGGILTAPGAISDETATRLKTKWDSGYSGENAGKVAVLGDNLKFEPMAVKAVDAQLIDQLKWSAEMVCSVFGVPAFKVGVGDPPTYTNIEGLDQQYYSQCLQIHIESIELALDEGLGLPDKLRTEFDLDQLLRMDSATLAEVEKNLVSAGIKAPNESRKKVNLAPVEGGESPYLQVQNFSLAALDRRDKLDLESSEIAVQNNLEQSNQARENAISDYAYSSLKKLGYERKKDLQELQT